MRPGEQVVLDAPPTRDEALAIQKATGLMPRWRKCRSQWCVEGPNATGYCDEHEQMRRDRLEPESEMAVRSSIYSLVEEITLMAVRSLLPYHRAIQALEEADEVFGVVQEATKREVRGGFFDRPYVSLGGKSISYSLRSREWSDAQEGDYSLEHAAEHAAYLGERVEEILGRDESVIERVPGAKQMIEAGILEKIKAALLYTEVIE